MGFLGMAVNVAVGLWTRTTVDSVAYDAARQVAAAPVGADPAAVQQEAIARAHQVLGAFAQQVRLDFERPADDGDVALRVRAPGVALLPRFITTGPVVGGIDRRIVVHREATP